jgi:hypothetical protein
VANNSRAYVGNRPLPPANGLTRFNRREARYRRGAYSVSRWERVRLPLVLIGMGSLAGAVLAYYLVVAFFAIMRKYYDRTN